MYRMHRIFCATAWETEGERRAFYDILGNLNQTKGIPAGTLFVPVSLINVHDKRPYQYTVDENIREAHYYMLVPGDDWGPPARTFERDYRLAMACAADPSLPMRQTAILLRNQPDGTPSPFAALLDSLSLPYVRFTTPGDFENAVVSLLSGWLAADSTHASAGGA